jgi:hypothetical protein
LLGGGVYCTEEAVAWGLPAGDGMEQTQQPEIPKALLKVFARLHPVALGVAFGVVGGAVIYFITAVVLIHAHNPLSPDLTLLAQFLYGYSVTWSGALIGLLWGFALGFAAGWSSAVIRNLIMHWWLVLARSRAEMEYYRDFLDHM